MIRRIGGAPRPGLAHRRRPGAYAVLIRAGRVLLTEQTTPDLCEVQLPGGGIDPGESPGPALTREVLEETGWTCRVERRLGAFRHFTWMPDYEVHAEKVCHVYLARPGLRLGPPHEAGHRALWLAGAEAVAALANEGNRAFLAAALGIGRTPPTRQAAVDRPW
ncbi:MAG: NUDIX hydrolase [Pseudomonadota bacterium]